MSKGLPGVVSITATKREILLRCVVKMIDEHGEASVRIGEIAKETHASPSSIYHYFGSREGIIAEAQVERYARSLNSYADLYEAKLAGVSSREGLKELVLSMNDQSYSPAWAPHRLARVNAVGSALGRPELQRKIAIIQEEAVVRWRELFRGSQERGWIRQDLDLKAFCAWALGNSFGRVLVELGDTSVDREEWNRISELAVLATLFGELERPLCTST